MSTTTTELREPEEYFLIGQDDTRLKIYLHYQLFKALQDFAKRESNKEQVGLLVGRLEEGEDEPFILVEDAIESPIGDESTGRFEESLWKRARRIAAARHPGRVVVGWFHSHLEGEAEVTEEEQGVHKRFFPEDKHLLYVICPKSQDRNFFYRGEDGSLQPANGFRIYGKKPANSGEEDIVPVSGAKREVNAVGASSEQQARHMERSLEKIQKRLQSPPMTAKDFAILALLAVNALLILFRPNPPVTVDTSALERGQSELSAQVSSVRGRIEKLERRLSDVTALDEQLKLAAGMEDIDDPDIAPTPDSRGLPLASEADQLAGGKGEVKLYQVVAGDVLGVLVDKFYPDSPEGTFTTFAEFNRLKGPDFAIFPGDTLKVPELETLRI